MVRTLLAELKVECCSKLNLLAELKISPCYPSCSIKFWVTKIWYLFWNSKFFWQSIKGFLIFSSTYKEKNGYFLQYVPILHNCLTVCFGGKTSFLFLNVAPICSTYVQKMRSQQHFLKGLSMNGILVHFSSVFSIVSE